MIDWLSRRIYGTNWPEPSSYNVMAPVALYATWFLFSAVPSVNGVFICHGTLFVFKLVKAP